MTEKLLLKITEVNAWERERWTYVLDANLQGGYVLNNLMIFVRLANEDFKKQYDAAPSNKMFAGSKYFFEFYDSIEFGKSSPVLVNEKTKLYLNGKGNYKEGGIYLDKKISPARIRSAMVAMRDQKKNKIYKQFESLFLK